MSGGIFDSTRDELDRMAAGVDTNPHLRDLGTVEPNQGLHNRNSGVAFHGKGDRVDPFGTVTKELFRNK